VVKPLVVDAATNTSSLTLVGGLNHIASAHQYTANQVPILILRLGCNQGDYSGDFDAEECAQCPLGTYANGSGFAECTPCGDGTTTVTVGATAGVDCTKCQPTACHGHGTCSATAGEVTCNCEVLWDDGKRCSTLRDDIVVGAVVLFAFLGMLTFVLAMRMRRRIFKLVPSPVLEILCDPV
jgi:hypothetical protein